MPLIGRTRSENTELQVYIPTLGRVGIERQRTLRQFMTKCRHEPILVCPANEVAAHKKYWPHVAACPFKGIGRTRQWIIETSRADIVVMADDDMRFCYRPRLDAPIMPDCVTIEPILTMVRDCVRRGFIHGGMAARQGSQNSMPGDKRVVELDGHLYVDCSRVNNFHYINRKAILKLGARFDRLTVMEDFHFTLTLLTQGYANRIIVDHVWDQWVSGDNGGCSIYRTAEVQAAGAEQLHAAFPKFVKVVEKQTRVAWSEFSTRKDVRIQWLKAYQSSKS